MSKMPNELDVPHWAIQRVKEVRTMYDVPEQVTDRMVYARLMEYNTVKPRTKQGLEDTIRSLESEYLEAVKNA